MLTDIVMADVSEAEAIGRSGGTHIRLWPCLESKGVDHDFFAALWEVLTDGAKGSSLIAADEHILYMESGGPWVIHLPEDLRDRLAALTAEQMGPVAARWVTCEELTMANVAAEDAEAYLVLLAEFARRAVQARKSLILWMCL
jgi:hypothetical protein